MFVHPVLIKPETADLRDSTTLLLLKEIQSRSTCTIKGYDPIVNDSEIRAMGIEPVVLPTGFKDVDILIIANNQKYSANLLIN